MAALFQDKIGLYCIVTVYRSKSLMYKRTDISSIQAYWIGISKDHVMTLEFPFPLKKHRRLLITMNDGSIIRARDIYIVL